MGFFDRLFGGGAKGSGSESDAAFRKIYTFMTNETVQNQRYPQELQQLMEAGGGVDAVANAIGEFGRALTNPIPVNGPIGELVYISNLTLPGGCKVIGHRLGSVDCIDVYETVTLDGSQWDLLFFDPYHTRKSQRLPNGYRVLSTPERFLLATNSAVPEFPDGIYESMRECTARLIGMPLVSPQLREEGLFQGFSRPPGHVRSLEGLRRDRRDRKD